MNTMTANHLPVRISASLMVGMFMSLVLFWGLWQLVRAPVFFVDHPDRAFDLDRGFSTLIIPPPAVTTPPQPVIDGPRGGTAIPGLPPVIVTPAGLNHVAFGLNGTAVEPIPPTLTPSGTNQEPTPRITVPPEYPPNAVTRGIEGWVIVQYIVTASGSVRDAFVVDSQPRRTFDKAAVAAILRYRYNPMIADGVPMERVGMQQKILFQLHH